MSKFLLVIPQCLPATQNLVTEHFKLRASWWHWSSDVWLLHFSEAKTVVQLRDEMMTLLPGIYLLVMQFEDRHANWAGWGTQEWQQWFDRYWDR